MCVNVVKTQEHPRHAQRHLVACTPALLDPHILREKGGPCCLLAAFLVSRNREKNTLAWREILRYKKRHALGKPNCKHNGLSEEADLMAPLQVGYLFDKIRAYYTKDAGTISYAYLAGGDEAHQLQPDALQKTQG
jgi:hypothetical protein